MTTKQHTSRLKHASSTHRLDASTAPLVHADDVTASLHPYVPQHPDFHDGWGAIRERCVPLTWQERALSCASSPPEWRSAVLVTHLDAARLEQVLQQERELSSSERRAALARELEKAAIVDARAIPPNVVTMNSQVVCEDEKTRVRHTVKLVYPAIKRAQNPGLSVLSPLGTALLGLSLGALIELPRGHRSAGPLRVRALPYQPERHGDFHL